MKIKIKTPYKTGIEKNPKSLAELFLLTLKSASESNKLLSTDLIPSILDP